MNRRRRQRCVTTRITESIPRRPFSQQLCNNTHNNTHIRPETESNNNTLYARRTRLLLLCLLIHLCVCTHTIRLFISDSYSPTPTPPDSPNSTSPRITASPIRRSSRIRITQLLVLLILSYRGVLTTQLTNYITKEYLPGKS